MNDYSHAMNYLDSLELNSPDKETIGFIVLWMVCNQNFKDYEGNCELDRFQNYFIEIASGCVADYVHEITERFKNTSSPAREYVLDMRTGSNRRVKLLVANRGLTVAQLAKVLYQIRCNLFHGEKNLLDEEEQNLIKWAYTVLSKIMQPVESRL